ncbi:hypothetical protein J1N35_026936 [Gossypium stocksii]|uniref:Uncharacterized protein n=1 Tax=Gossypium stocksii TaxID=47602 RepID=A0A9D3VBH9_9ROSI|nr:hypothetical protein J1N35_026936 [Gossypium stocksii]
MSSPLTRSARVLSPSSPTVKASGGPMNRITAVDDGGTVAVDTMGAGSAGGQRLKTLGAAHLGFVVCLG